MLTSPSAISVAPQFTVVPPSPTFGVVDGDVMFRYKVIGTPKPTVSWMRDGVALSAEASYLEPGDGFLKATGLINSDAGMYQAFARNAAGESQMSVELVIRSGKSADTSISISLLFPFHFYFHFTSISISLPFHKEKTQNPVLCKQKEFVFSLGLFN